LPLATDGQGLRIPIGNPPALIQHVGRIKRQLITNALAMRLGDVAAQVIRQVLVGGGQAHLGVGGQVLHLALPHAQRPRLHIDQPKSQPALRHHFEKIGLHRLELAQVRHAAIGVQRWRFAGGLHLFALL